MLACGWVEIKVSGDSLSGQNEGRRVAGLGSSPNRPTKSQKTILWHRLRRLDRQCHQQQTIVKQWRVFRSIVEYDKICKKAEGRFARYDAQRKEVRLKLKGYL